MSTPPERPGCQSRNGAVKKLYGTACDKISVSLFPGMIGFHGVSGFGSSIKAVQSVSTMMIVDETFPSLVVDTIDSWASNRPTN